MYTLEEIEEEAKAYKWKCWRWCLVFSLAFFALFVLVLLPAMIKSYHPHGDNFFFYFEFIGTLVLILVTWSLPEKAYKGKKKQLEEENRHEEQQKREDHYKRMEELLEKMTKEKENA